MLYGIIKKLSDRGFGFIEQHGGPDVYFRADEIGDELFRRLRTNQPVMFELARRTADELERQRELKQKKGPRAGIIKLIDRIPGGILPPPQRELAARHHPKAKQRKATWKRRIDVSGKKPD